MSRPVERLRTYLDVVAATDGDPSARWGVDPSLPLDGAARNGAVVWTVQREHYAGTSWLNVLGPPPAVAALVADLLVGELDPLTPQPAGITVPHGALELLPTEVRPTEHGDWTWWWTDAPPPPQSGESMVTELPITDDPHVHDELVAMLLEASPTASADPTDDGVRTWCGIRLDGTLVASAADRPYVHGVPHLASIATLPSARGRGYGGAVTAWLTRRRLVEDETAVVTLGMYSENVVARSVYLRLGFRPEHRFASGPLPTPHARRAPSAQ